MTDNARIVREALDRMTTTGLDTARAKAEAIDALYDLSSELAAYKRLTKELEGEDIKLRVALSEVQADLERAREEIKRKDWAIAKALGWFHDPDENPLTQFERIGDWFFDETGHLRPGKDDRTENTSSPENRDRFVKWCQDKSRERLADLRAALAPEQKGE